MFRNDKLGQLATMKPGENANKAELEHLIDLKLQKKGMLDTFSDEMLDARIDELMNKMKNANNGNIPSLSRKADQYLNQQGPYYEKNEKPKPTNDWRVAKPHVPANESPKIINFNLTENWHPAAKVAYEEFYKPNASAIHKASDTIKNATKAVSDFYRTGDKINQQLSGYGIAPSLIKNGIMPPNNAYQWDGPRAFGNSLAQAALNAEADHLGTNYLRQRAFGPDRLNAIKKGAVGSVLGSNPRIYNSNLGINFNDPYYKAVEEYKNATPTGRININMKHYNDLEKIHNREKNLRQMAAQNFAFDTAYQDGLWDTLGTEIGQSGHNYINTPRSLFETGMLSNMQHNFPATVRAQVDAGEPITNAYGNEARARRLNPLYYAGYVPAGKILTSGGKAAFAAGRKSFNKFDDIATQAISDANVMIENIKRAARNSSLAKTAQSMGAQADNVFGNKMTDNLSNFSNYGKEQFSSAINSTFNKNAMQLGKNIQDKYYGHDVDLTADLGLPDNFVEGVISNGLKKFVWDSIKQKYVEIPDPVGTAIMPYDPFNIDNNFP